MRPFIPEDAPFSAEQRVWLNGFLAGLFLDSHAESAAPTQSLEVAVYFATQSGTAERLAKKLSKALKAAGHRPAIASVENVTPKALASQKVAVFFASTYGEGDPPDNATNFRDLLFAESASSLQGLRYAVFSLGDRSYENFCKFGSDLDERLESLGAERLLPRLESDVDVDAFFEPWHTQLIETVIGQHSFADAVTDTPVPTNSIPQKHNRDNPYHAKLRERTPLTRNFSSKLTMHLAFDLEGSDVHYQVGDACGILAQNDPALIEAILSQLPFVPSTVVSLPQVGDVSIEEALLFHLQPSRLTRKMVQAFAAKAGCGTLASMMQPEQSAHLNAYIYDRGLIDLLQDYPGVIGSPEELVAMLPKLAPRLYSISSSPAVHGRELHCTVAVVRYRSHNRERGGVASTMLADRVAVGSRVPIYIQPNSRFRVPSDSNTPVIMIGPGTGIAPFRAFLHERRALGHAGRNWLFFGERSASSDFLYGCELTQFAEEGHLTRLDTAFSRDQSHKVYVQDRMLEAGGDLFRWLEEGAELYVCGDASRMAKDVHRTLHRIVETHGSMTPDAAQEYVSALSENHRYHRDVY